MNPAFADACFWIALLNERDALHTVALQLDRDFRRRRKVTTELVLVEVLNFFAEWGAEKRRAAAAFALGLRNDRRVDVLEMSTGRFWEAVAFYNARPDQEWGLVDCASFQLMQAYNIREALTNDRHFTQAGFITLM